MSDLAAKIFAVEDIESELVDVEIWGVTVLVKSMTARARQGMIARTVDENGKMDISQVLPEMVIACTYDPETGEKVFKDSDREALLAKSAAAIEQISTVAMRLSGMTAEAVAAVGKDLPSTQNDASSLS
jgi:hypothetical protein